MKGTKNEGTRDIPVRKRLLDALEIQQEIQNLQKLEFGSVYENNNLVCCRENGEFINPSTLDSGFKAILKRAGVRQTNFHNLRHTHISMLLQEEPVHVVSQRAGHKSPIVTLTIYAHVIPQNYSRCADTFERMLDNA